jgi:pyruvate,water dikinase
MGEDVFVAVRSSATAEDLPDASFAGQQETFLNVTREDLLDRIRRCWASLFTQRAIYYRQKQGFAHDVVNIAVVVQKMVDSEKSGVMFTSHPSTGEPKMIIEAAWGLGEAVVAGEVSPDNYILDRETGDLDSITVTEKKVMHEKDPETGETVENDVPEDKREAQVLSEEELDSLREIGEKVEAHYETPQDVEWAIIDGEVYMLQSRPITTISDDGSQGGSGAAESAADGGATTQSASASDASAGDDVLVQGLGASPGIASGAVRVVKKLDHLDKVGEGDIIVTEMTTPDMVPAMKRASGIATDEGGMTSHAAIVTRELGVPAVVGTGNASTTLADDQFVTVDGDMGTITEGRQSTTDQESSEPAARPAAPAKPATATEVKTNISIPEAAARAAESGADGVGLLRIEHMILSTNKTPERYIADHGEDAYIDEIVSGIRSVAEEFYPRPVRARTLDAPTDEFRQLEGGDDEPVEHNPMLGYRGIRRSLDAPEEFKLELRAFRKLYEMGYDNVELMIPLVNDAEDVMQAKALMEEVGIDPRKRPWGVMVETPAAALSIEDICETGVHFVSFGTNDLTQYTLAVDRNNENVADRFSELHPAVLSLISSTIETCREHDVATSICGQAGSKPEMVEFLVNEGVTSISSNVDAVPDVQQQVSRVEQRLLLENIR